MRGKEGNSTNPTKFLPLHFVKENYIVLLQQISIEPLPIGPLVNGRLAKIGIFELSAEEFLTSLDEAPGREEAVGGQRVDPGLVVRQLKKS